MNHQLRRSNCEYYANHKPASGVGHCLYHNPKPHYKSFRYVLDKLCLTPDDVFLDVCCGGGTLLSWALRTVHRAAGLDHSPDMIALTRGNNIPAIDDGRLEVRQGDATALPWNDATFDAVANANALFFLSNPVKVLREAHRVLKPDGRFAVITTAKRKFDGDLFGPRCSFIARYTDAELADMLRQANFSRVKAYSPGGYLQIGYGVKE